MSRLALAIAALVGTSLVTGPHLLRAAALEVRLPSGWFAQACHRPAPYSSDIRFATVRFLSGCNDAYANLTQRRLRRGGVLIVVQDLGVSKQSLRFFPKGKLVVTAIATHPLEGTNAPAQALARREIRSHFILAVIDFGERHPPASAFVRANSLLARIRVT